MSDPQANANRLLRKMHNAESTLSLSGKQITILFRPNGTIVQTTQMVYRDGPDNYRCEFLSPKRLAGDLVISHGAMSWRYSPNKKDLKIGAPHPRHLMTEIGPALKALKAGQAQITINGSDVVAGIPTRIVQISGAGATQTASIKIWIDPRTGAQLKTDVFDATGNPQSSSFFTSVDYSPTFPADAFAAPTVPPGTKTEVEQHFNQMNRIPTDAEAGFHVLKPSSLPTGYRFLNASLFTIGGRQAVALRYQGHLSLLSVFESPQDPGQHTADAASSPRAGTVVLDRRGMQFAAMGTLDDKSMLKVLNSLN